MGGHQWEEDDQRLSLEPMVGAVICTLASYEPLLGAQETEASAVCLQGPFLSQIHFLRF